MDYSPTPWGFDPTRHDKIDIVDTKGFTIVNCGGWHDSRNPNQATTKEANARLIVRAVNSHEALVAAGKEALGALHQLHPQQHHMAVGVGICEWRPCQNLRKAIALAEKEA